MSEDEVAIHVYWANPYRSMQLRHLLDEVELQRLAALRKPDDQARFVTSHALARLVVGLHAGLDDALVLFNRTCPICGGPHGKPTLAPETPTRDHHWHVSLSHSADVVLVAITRAGPVGIDVESIEGSGFDGFDTVALSRAEAAQLARYPETRRAQAQATWWTRKEAIVKATGDGLTVAPTRIVVSSPAEAPALLAWRGSGAPKQPVHLYDIDLGPGYASAVAVISDDERPHVQIHRGNDVLETAATET